MTDVGSGGQCPESIIRSIELIPSRVECIFEGAKGFIMIDQIRTIEKFCFIKKLGELENDVQINLCDRIQEFFAY